MSRVIAIDWETFYDTKSDYGIQQLGTWRYLHDDRFDPYLISVCDGVHAWAGHYRDFNWDSLHGATLLSHNRHFDESVYEAGVEKNLFPRVQLAGWHCTANMSACLSNRRALDSAVEFLLGRKVSKEVRKYADGKTADTMKAEGRWNSMLEYGRSDVINCHELYTKHGHRWTTFERRLSDLTIRQCKRGVQIDVPKLQRYREFVSDAVKRMEQAIPWVRDGLAGPKGRKALAEQCRKDGIPTPPVKSHQGGEEAYAKWYADYAPKIPWIRNLADYFSVQILFETLEKIHTRTRPDGVMPFGLKYFGAHCMTGDAEVLTKTGWQRLDEWGGGEIMQWDGTNLCFDSAVANKFDVTSGERLLTLKTGLVHSTMTEGHWLALFNCKTGERNDIQAAEARSGRWKMPISAEFKNGIVSLPEWKSQLLVAVQADGHYLTDCRSIRFRLSRSRKIERLRGILLQSGLDWKETRYPSEPDVSVFIIRQFPDWLEGRKEWGAELLTWDAETRKTILNELVHWDGSRCGPNSVEYVTTSENNAKWISTLCHISSLAASVSVKKRAGNWNTAFRVFIRPSTKTEIRSKNWTDSGPAERVFCPTAKHGACLFRQNGTIFITKQTGRWSGDAGINLQNLRKESYYFDELRLLCTDSDRLREIANYVGETGNPPEWVSFTVDLRSLIIARPGTRLVVSDLAQIEPRVLAWLVGDKAMLASMASGKSPYQAHAEATMGWNRGDMKKLIAAGDLEVKELYALAKARVLGLGYQCAWEKFITVALVMAGLDITKDDPKEIQETVEQDGVELPVYNADGSPKMISGYGWNSKRIVKEYRKQNPLVADKEVGIWYRLDRAFKASVGGDFTMELPSGRKMVYRNVRREVSVVFNEETKKYERKWTTKAEVVKNGVPARQPLYGGVLTENLDQATSRDVFGENLLGLDEHPGVDVLFSSHDEAICEVSGDATADDVNRIMARTPEWIAGCPIAAETKYAPHYLK